MPSPSDLGFLLCAALTLAPSPGQHITRNGALDITRVKSAQCEYRGITASFEELTRAYAIEVFEGAQFVGWQTRPSPRDPEHEALVIGVFTARALKPLPASAPFLDARRQALPSFGVTWALGDLGAQRIAPYDDYARDALETFRQTVDNQLARMVFSLEAAQLRAGPGPDHPVEATVSPGTAMLREEERSGWIRVRVPATTTTGWLPQDQLRTLGHE